MSNGLQKCQFDTFDSQCTSGRAAEAQWQQTVAALRFSEMLRRLSWQHLALRLAIHEPPQWLVDGLRGKYGIIGQL